MLPHFIARIKKDSAFRTTLFLCLSFLCNMAYAAFLLVAGVIYSSNWFFTVAVYYALLSIVRIFVFRQLNPLKPLTAKIKTVRACGVFLFLINVSVSGMMFLLLRERTVAIYHEITVITLATYTFSALAFSIFGTAKYVRADDHVFTCCKTISLVCANVSMVTLTNTMLRTWGAENHTLRKVIMPLLCGTVAILIIVYALVLIHTANERLRSLSYEQKRE